MEASPTSRRVGLSKQVIIQQAARLSEHKGIDGWSMRDIAKELDVVPSVLYHYFPNKDCLCDAVVDQVCASIAIPDLSLDWKAWFTQLAHGIRPVLLRYYGITERLVRGKITPQFLPVLDAAYQKLDEAGFGNQTAFAYSIITNTAINAIGARNLRSANQTGEPHDLNLMLDRFAPLLDKSPGLRYLVNAYLEPLSHPDQEEQLSDKYFDLIVAVVLDGVEHILLPAAEKL